MRKASETSSQLSTAGTWITLAFALLFLGVLVAWAAPRSGQLMAAVPSLTEPRETLTANTSNHPDFTQSESINTIPASPSKTVESDTVAATIGSLEKTQVDRPPKERPRVSLDSAADIVLAELDPNSIKPEPELSIAELPIESAGEASVIVSGLDDILPEISTEPDKTESVTVVDDRLVAATTLDIERQLASENSTLPVPTPSAQVNVDNLNQGAIVSDVENSIPVADVDATSGPASLETAATDPAIVNRKSPEEPEEISPKRPVPEGNDSNSQVKQVRLEHTPVESEYERERREALSQLYSLSTEVRFLSGSAETSGSSVNALDRIFETLFLFSESAVRIHVSSNDGTSNTENEALSGERIKSIIDYLTSRGLDGARFSAEELGAYGLPRGAHRVTMSATVVQ